MKNSMKNFSLMWKQFLRFFLIIVLTSAFIVYFASKEVRKNYLRNLECTLENYARLIEKFVSTSVAANDQPQIESITKKLANELGIRCTIIAKDGTVLGDSEEDPAKMEDHSNRPEVIAALQSGVGSCVRHSDTLKKEMLYIAVPIVYQDRIIGIIRTSSFIENVQRSLSAITKNIIGTTLFITFLALVLSIITTQAYTKPIRDIAKAANRIREGDFKTRLYIKRRDELGVLAESLNEMARELEDYFLSLKEEQEGLKTILSSMVEALVVLNKDGEIVTVNQNFVDIMNESPDDIIGKRYWEYIRESDFAELIEHVVKTKKFMTKEIKLTDKIYLTSCSIVKDIPEIRIIIVMHEITELKRLEEVKTDFVANVAHELKTPLTAIKGFAETLEDEASENNRRFIKIIRTNTDRLINIVSDLLVISNLEHKKENIEVKEFDLEKLIENSLTIEHKKLEEKNIDVTFDFECSIPQFKGDPFLIEQMMINLLDNAIIYTEKNGEIHIEASEEENTLIIVIKDTGIGIPTEHLPRIFERFYVVDKSRSRQFGGTGLGLSIVKHIVLSHNGEIRVESTVGEGTTFIITLPLL